MTRKIGESKDDLIFMPGKAHRYLFVLDNQENVAISAAHASFDWIEN